MMKFVYRQNEYRAQYLLSSKYSDFWITENFILKVRKDHCDIFGDTSPEEALFQTNAEYARGRRFEPSIYLDVVHCVNEAGEEKVGLLMKYIDNSCRLDSASFTISEHYWNNFINKLQYLVDSSSIVTDFNYMMYLDRGNRRLLENVKQLSDSEWLQTAWNTTILKTQSFSSTLNNRVLRGYVKDLHGDLSFTNVYFDNEVFYFLDPCVASPDMYYIDVLYQFADFMCELVRYNQRPVFDRLLNHISQKDYYSQELFVFYLLRHCLIRATVHFLAGEEDYLSYKKTWEELHVFSECTK